MLEYLLLLTFPVAMAFGGVKDLLTLTIPNKVSLFLLGAFLIVAPVVGLSFNEFVWHLGAGALVLAIAFGLYSAGFIGGGDAKLASAAALWVGFDQLMPYFTYVALMGGGLAVAMLLFRCVPVAALPVPAWALRLHDNATGMPYGVAIASAALLIYPETHWFQVLAT